MKLMVDAGAFGAKPDYCYLVGRFANEVYEIVVVGRPLSPDLSIEHAKG